MRTTIDLDTDLLAQAKLLARKRNITLGRCISELALKALKSEAPMKVRNGAILLNLKPGTRKADLNLVNTLRDQE